MRPDSIQAMAKAAISEPMVSSAPQASRQATAAKAMSVGSPTEISQGASCAVEEPVMRSLPSDQRVISIEDTMELKLHVPNRVRLLSNADTNVTTQLLVALCLRFRPDRIIVGEVRGGEAYDLLQALNTGHDGGLASIHANNGRTALSRLESLAMLGIPTGSRWELEYMRKNIADCFNYVVHFKRTGEMRHVSEILEIRGFKNNDYDLQRVF